MKINTAKILLLMVYFLMVCCAPCDDGIEREDDTANKIETNKTQSQVYYKDSVDLVNN